MHIIYLAGNSLNNKTWIEKVKSEFDSFSSGDILYYDHWPTGEKWINLQKESEKLMELVKDKKDYFVFAKSIGSILALKCIYKKIINPKKMIICGHPYRALPNDDYLKSLKIPTIFIQNEFDPVSSFTELKKTLAENSPAGYRLIKNKGNSTHDYEDFESLASITKEFFK